MARVSALVPLVSLALGCPTTRDDGAAARPMVAAPSASQPAPETGPPGSATACRTPAGRLMHEGDICDLEDVARSEQGAASFLHCYAQQCRTAADICAIECAKPERDPRQERLLQLCAPRCGRP